jgi:hypothetical protein
VLWIRIRIRTDLTILDPDQFWESGSGSGFKRKEINQIFR